jgi:hypothetical protein
MTEWTFAAAPEFAGNFLPIPDGKVYCQSNGPKLAYVSLLDSDATYPSLYEQDFHNLGTDYDNYAAQTVDEMETANGIIRARTFEMFVSDVQEGTCESLVDKNDAVSPYHGKYLGGSVRLPQAPNQRYL